MRLVPNGGRPADHGRASRPVRALASAAAVLAGLILVAGCQFPGMSSSAAPATTGTITVGAAPGIGDAPLYIASQQNMFRDAGVTVHIINYNSAQAELKDLQSGKLDVAFGDYADFFYAQAKASTQKKIKNPLKLMVVADGYDAAANTMEVLALPQSHIVTAKNLEHKSIGTDPAGLMPAPGSPGIAHGTPYSLDTVATQSVLHNNNVTLSSINWQPLPSQMLISDLAKGQVDAILATEPTIFQAESQLGAVPVLDSCTGATANLPLEGYFTTHTLATKDHAALLAFRSALERAQAAASQSAPVRKTLQGSVGLSMQNASLVTLGQYPTTVSASDLQRVVSLMFTFSAIPTPLSVQSMIFH